MIDLSGTLDLLRLGFVQQALVAGAVLALLAGLLGPLVIGRTMAFAVHGTSEVSFAGAAAALLIGGTTAVGVGALVGAVVVAVVFGALGLRERERDSVIGVVLSFGLGLGVLFQALYKGGTANKFSLLVGQIVGVDTSDVLLLALWIGVTSAGLVRDLARQRLGQLRPGEVRDIALEEPEVRASHVDQILRRVPQAGGDREYGDDQPDADAEDPMWSHAPGEPVVP